MKTNLLHLVALAALFVAAPRARAEVSIEVFYDSLEPYGDWLQVADYGYCWQPRDVGAGWRPYTVGEWVYTDAGWTWLSDEPFGWATYHYGRWARLAQRGWVWVPDTQWGPAWVSWRHSDRYVGWAPLPPETRLIVDVSLGAWVDSYYDVGPTAYCFVETRQFGASRLADVVIAPQENLTIIRETRNVTNVKVVNNLVINNGPDYVALARAADRPIRKLRLEREDAAPSATTSANLKARVEGDTVKIAAPRVTAQAAAKPRKVTQQVQVAEVDRGWKDAGPAAEVQPLREKMKAEAKAPNRLPAPNAPAKNPIAERPAPKLPLPPIAEPPLRKAPTTQRIESRPPTPEPRRNREPLPDSIERPKPVPPVSQPPGIERPDLRRVPRGPKAEEPRVITPTHPKAAAPERPLPPEPRVQRPEAGRPAKPEPPGKGHEKPKDGKPEKDER